MAVLYGFETKKFFGSGIYDDLSSKHQVVVIKRNFPSENFSEYVESYSLEVESLNIEGKGDRFYIEKLHTSSRRARHRLRGLGNFNYFVSDKKKGFRDYLIGNLLVNRLLHLTTVAMILRLYIDSNVLDF